MNLDLSDYLWSLVVNERLLQERPVLPQLLHTLSSRRHWSVSYCSCLQHNNKIANPYDYSSKHRDQERRDKTRSTCKQSHCENRTKQRAWLRHRSFSHRGPITVNSEHGMNKQTEESVDGVVTNCCPCRMKNRQKVHQTLRCMRVEIEQRENGKKSNQNCYPKRKMTSFCSRSRLGKRKEVFFLNAKAQRP